MQKKQERQGASNFHGDVGQAVLGNVHEAPRLNNVVNVKLSDAPPEKTALTWMQRNFIRDKVNHLSAVSRQESIEIYRALLADFGAQNMDDFPGERYKEATAILDEQIAELKPEKPEPKQEVRQAAPAPVPPPTVVRLDTQTQSLCPACLVKAGRSGPPRILVITQVCALVVLAAAAWQWSQQPAAASAASAAGQCQFAGNAYSPGSTARMESGGARECVLAEAGPQWVAVQQSRGR